MEAPVHEVKEAPVHEVKEAPVHEVKEEETRNKKRHLNLVSIGHVGELTFDVFISFSCVCS